MEKKILVIGATGNVGVPVAQRLKADGFQVRVMSRNANKARQIFDETFEVVVGDPVNAADLRSTLEGCYGVHINLNGESEQQVAEQVSQAASELGVQRISYISGATVREENRWFPMIEYKFQAETAIRNSGVSYTIFKPTWIMESLPQFVQDGRASILGKQPHPFHWVAAEDYARMVSAAFQNDNAANKEFYIHGPEAISMNDALSAYIAVKNPEIEKVGNLPFWMAKLIAAMTKSADLKSAAAMMAYFEKVGEEGDPSEANALLGAPQISLQEWLA
jgi:uncharacterized protein YbjT (DUF2867 family)